MPGHFSFTFLVLSFLISWDLSKVSSGIHCLSSTKFSLSSTSPFWLLVLTKIGLFATAIAAFAVPSSKGCFLSHITYVLTWRWGRYLSSSLLPFPNLSLFFFPKLHPQLWIVCHWAISSNYPFCCGPLLILG